MKTEIQHYLVQEGNTYILVRNDRCLSTKALAEKLDVNISHVKKHIVTLHDFPTPIHFEEKSHPKWLESDIDLWLQQKKRA